MASPLRAGSLAIASLAVVVAWAPLATGQTDYAWEQTKRLLFPYLYEAPSPGPSPTMWDTPEGKLLHERLFPELKGIEEERRRLAFPKPVVLTADGILDRLSGRLGAVSLYNEGRAHFLEHRPRQAIEAWGKALSSYDLPEIHYAMGLAHLYLKLPDGVLDHFRAAVRLQPGHVDASRGVTLCQSMIEVRQRGY